MQPETQHPQTSPVVTQPSPEIPTNQPTQQEQKSYLITFLFTFFLGTLGVDRFYLGYIGTGILKLLTFGGFGIWNTVDLIFTVANKRKAKDGTTLSEYDRYKKLTLTIVIVWLLIGVGLSIAATSFTFRQSRTDITLEMGDIPAENTSEATSATATPLNARWTYTAEEKAAAEKFVNKYNNEYFSRGACDSQPVTMYDVHVKDYTTVFRYRCGSSQVNGIGVYERSSVSPDDWEPKLDMSNESYGLPDWVVNTDPEFYRTVYGAPIE